MSEMENNEMEGIPPFPKNGEPVVVTVLPVIMKNFPIANPEEE
ncbi:hypothetical protein [Klebsiella grimontii]|nr:hypothetical protein [Klebsiella grimontii]